MNGISHTRGDGAVPVIRLEHLRGDSARGGDGIGDASAELPPAWSPTRTLDSTADNVVPFVRPRQGETAGRSVGLAVAADERPAPAWARPDSRLRMASLVTLSIAAHVGLYALAWHDPEPLASVGIETMSIEIVLGGETVAGDAEKPQEVEAETAPQVEEVKPEEQVAEKEELTTQEPQETPVAARETAPEEQPQDQTAEVKPEEQTYVAMVETPTAEIATVKPQETPADMSALITPPSEPRKVVKPVEDKPKPKPPIKKNEIAPERRRIAARTAEEPKQERAAPARPKAPSSGVGVGRSANDPNYRALVAAHLQRYKQYPSDARNAHQQGTGSVTFSLDGGGRVTSANVTRGTGVGSLDRELAAMVHRASPFPAPPGGRAMTFSVPVNFHMQ